MERVVVGGQECVRLASGRVSVDVATEVGPRILGLSLAGGENLFAETPEIVLRDHGANCRLYGGHRLWEAPEVPSRTWIAEDGPVDVHVDDGARQVTVTGPVLRDQVRKRLIVHLDDLDSVVVRHRLVNVGHHSVGVAPWALSMLRPGGTAILPFALAARDDAGLQASATRIVLWPYTDLTDPAIDWRADAVLVDTAASSRDSSFKNKIGCASPAGWCAYIVDGEMLVKRSQPCESPIDGGATQQLYWDCRFTELETLGPLVELAPGETTEHVESWELRRVERGDQYSGWINPSI